MTSTRRFPKEVIHQRVIDASTVNLFNSPTTPQHFIEPRYAFTVRIRAVLIVLLSQDSDVSMLVLVA
jgi:hypothetical protein